MIIDSHAHVLAFPKLMQQSYNTTFMSAEDQIKVMDAKGIDKALILPCNSAESPLEPQSAGEILYICEKYPGRFIPCCTLDPRLPRRPANILIDDYLYILKQYKDLGFKAFGELTARLTWNDPSMLLLLDACQI